MIYNENLTVCLKEAFQNEKCVCLMRFSDYNTKKNKNKQNLFVGNLLEPKLQQLQMKICRADFHGAIIKVKFE